MSGIPAGAGSLLGKRLGKYEILALLALGGTAEIYLARIGGAAGFEKYVVVKCLHDHLADDQEFVKMFLDEARLAAYLDHSNIVQTMELGEYENRYYMVMEFLAGLSLAMIVRRAGERIPGGRIPVPLVLNMMAQSCAGLHYAHERSTNNKPLNIVHRDISPQNLVVSFEGVVKVVDFGIAKAEMRETRTRSGTIKGKFAYMSPEQCVANNVDRRTDVFALGVITHELLTGRRLFKKPSPYETYQSVIECNIDPPSRFNVEVDPAIDPIVMLAVAKDKEQRYPTAEAYGDALLGYLHHRGKGSGPGDVARFFDTTFEQEIEEHGARMRELISGRDFSVETGVKWDGDEEPKRQETIDLATGSENSVSHLETGDLLPVGTIADGASSNTLSNALDDLDPTTDVDDDDDDMPVERTRIEANPLEKVNELEQIARKTVRLDKTPSPQMTRPQNIPTVIATPAPTDPAPLPAPPTGPLTITPPHGRPVAQPGRFPDLANQPTAVAADDPQIAAELARAESGHGNVVDPLGRTNVDLGPPNFNGRGSVPPPMQPPVRPSPMQLGPQALPMSYPVVNKQMSRQMMQGATVYPSDTPPQVHTYDSGPYDPVGTASPVGQHYPGDVDWAAAAAAPAKPIPPWVFVVLFVGALGIALGLTVAIAKLLS